MKEYIKKLFDKELFIKLLDNDYVGKVISWIISFIITSSVVFVISRLVDRDFMPYGKWLIIAGTSITCIMIIDIIYTAVTGRDGIARPPESLSDKFLNLL